MCCHSLIHAFAATLQPEPNRCCLQAEVTLQGVVKSLEAAGVVLVPMNLTEVEELNYEINPVVLNIQYEIGRELAR